MSVSTLKGTRDFSQEEMAKRKYLFGVLESVFLKYGYRAIETPAMERLDVLTGKYGEEGDKLLFKVLNNGDFLAKVDDNVLTQKDSQAAIKSLSKRGLRYDLTVPLARYVVANQSHIAFPFKRYQIQPVWRADRPQKGRYQEFFQCDVDVIGAASPIQDAELLLIYHEAFKNLGLDVEIKVNHRDILFGLCALIGAEDKFMNITVIIDKLDKIGKEKVHQELTALGISTHDADTILELIFAKTIDEISAKIPDNDGVKEIKEILSLAHSQGAENVIFDPSLARGLSYYTGMIVEVVSTEMKYGSIGGGGRYANLTEVFGLKNMPGVGVSFGADRIYDIMDVLGKFDNQAHAQLKALFIPMDSEVLPVCFEMLSKLRQNGIQADMYPRADKLKKQFKYADSRNAQYVIVVGENEIKSGRFTVKNMESGNQEEVSQDALTAYFLEE